MDVLKKILPALIGKEIETVDDLKRCYEDTPGYPVTKLGIEGAFFDLLAKEQGVSLQDVFGGDRKVVEIGESIGIKSSIQDVLDEVREVVDAGFKRVKIKIKPGYDIDVIRAVRESFPELLLAADANMAYVPEQINTIKELEQFNLIFIEQPFDADEYETHAKLQTSMKTPICLDETIRDLETTKKAVEMNCCKMINIKPARIGSFSESIAVHDYCFEKGIDLFGGGRMETGCGRTQNAHLFSLPGFTLPSDMTPPLAYFPEDTVQDSFIVKNGEHVLKQGIGIAKDVLESVIEKYIKERCLFE